MRAAARNPWTPRPERALVTRISRQRVAAGHQDAHPRLQRRAASARPGSRLVVSRDQRCASPAASLESAPSHTPRALAGATTWRALRASAGRRDGEIYREMMRHVSRVLRSNRRRDCPCARASLSLPIYICACVCMGARVRMCVCARAYARVRLHERACVCPCSCVIEKSWDISYGGGRPVCAFAAGGRSHSAPSR